MERKAAAIGVIVAVVVSGMLQPAAATPTAFSYRNPFNPEQCDRAIAAGKKQHERDPSNPKGSLLLAEGLLCKGLQDDPGALDAAIDLLRPIVAQQPSNFFAQLDLADALRRRFPLSDEAASLLRQVRDQLSSANVGAARSDLAEYASENLAALDRQRLDTLPLLHAHETAFETGTATPDEVPELASLLALTGPQGLAHAAQIIEAYAASHPEDTVAALYRTEISRGRARPSEASAHYAAAEIRLCRSDAPYLHAAECALARLRLAQLAKAGESGGPVEADPPPP